MSSPEDLVEKQLRNMEAFIKKEAEEKARMLMDKAEQEFTIEKAALVQDERQRIKKEYERKLKQLDMKQRIDESKSLNSARLKVLIAREELVNHLRDSTLKRLPQLSASSDYPQILNNLIAQVLMKLDEPVVSLRCRQSDASLVKAAIPKAVAIYKQKFSKDCKVTIDAHNYLPEADGGEGSVTCAGGVIGSTPDGHIMCDNTFDQRLELAFEAMTPNIRQILFPEDI